jgi:molecular chaperone DnaK (HSP70)
MARFGIDFGTTNTVLVCSDRGRYPVVPHVTDSAIGQVIREVFPSLTVYDREDGRLRHGLEAEQYLGETGWEKRYGVIRSLKRLLRNYVEDQRIGSDARGEWLKVSGVLRSYAGALRESVLRSQFMGEGEPIEAVITWPANANGAQRYITRRFFKEAGFEVLDAINEPTAAAIEFADRIAKGNRSRARKVSAWVAVFDLGGGTFDASLVRIEGAEFTVANAGGIGELGGSDFDEVLARLFTDRMKVNFDELDPGSRELLLRHARQQKESISSGLVETLKLNPAEVGLPGRPLCSVPVAAYFAELRPLIERAVEKLWAVVSGAIEQGVGVEPGRLDAVYLVGGSSLLPLVARMVAERFPNTRLTISDKPFTATAMGAAIHSAEGLTVHDVLSRTFGVIRLAENGTREYFASIFHAGTRLPDRGAAPLEFVAEYSPMHNIGRLRYLECAGVDDAGRPAEGLRGWSEILFPYDPAIRVGQELSPGMIVRRDDLANARVRETYRCDGDGVITVTLTRCCDGQSCAYEVFKSLPG